MSEEIKKIVKFLDFHKSKNKKKQAHHSVKKKQNPRNKNIPIEEDYDCDNFAEDKICDHCFPKKCECYLFEPKEFVNDSGYIAFELYE